jgi:hypothetical protein
MPQHWKSIFDEPIALPDVRKLRTLQEAIAFLAKEIPRSEHTLPKVQPAARMVSEAAENNGPMIFAEAEDCRGGHYKGPPMRAIQLAVVACLIGVTSARAAETLTLKQLQCQEAVSARYQKRVRSRKQGDSPSSARRSPCKRFWPIGAHRCLTAWNMPHVPASRKSSAKVFSIV